MRAWAAEPGEYFNALDGGYGGLWRRNGRPPQRLVGVGFAGEGPFWGKAYQRAPGADDPRASFISEGVDDQVLGDFGFSGGGAAGFEVDRTEPALGTPSHALVLASASGYPEGFMLAMEEWLSGGHDLVRSATRGAAALGYGLLRNRKRRCSFFGRLDLFHRQPPVQQL